MNSDLENLNHLIACPQCDAISVMPNINEGQVASCHRCGAKLLECKSDPINRTMAVSLAGLILLLPAVSLPLIGIHAAGLFNNASLIDCIALLIDGDFYLIAISLFIFTLAVPAVRLFAALYICWSLKFNRLSPSLLKFFRSYHHLDSWVMLHVFFLGLIVSMYKLISLAELSIGLGFFAFVLLLLCSTLISVTLDQHLVWKKLEGQFEH